MVIGGVKRKRALQPEEGEEAVVVVDEGEGEGEEGGGSGAAAPTLANGGLCMFDLEEEVKQPAPAPAAQQPRIKISARPGQAGGGFLKASELLKLARS